MLFSLTFEYCFHNARIYEDVRELEKSQVSNVAQVSLYAITCLHKVANFFFFYLDDLTVSVCIFKWLFSLLYNELPVLRYLYLKKLKVSSMKDATIKIEGSFRIKSGSKSCRNEERLQPLPIPLSICAYATQVESRCLRPRSANASQLFVNRFILSFG